MEELDKQISALCDLAKANNYNLKYVITSLLAKAFFNKEDGVISNDSVTQIIGILETTKLQFYRRLMAFTEDVDSITGEDIPEIVACEINMDIIEEQLEQKLIGEMASNNVIKNLGVGEDVEDDDDDDEEEDEDDL